ncbi:MAG: alpha-galactosidase [Verrucomicrobiota bacterium]
MHRFDTHLLRDPSAASPSHFRATCSAVWTVFRVVALAGVLSGGPYANAAIPAPDRLAPHFGRRATKAEMEKARQWTARSFSTRAEPPWSFVYGGRSSSELLKTWRVSQSEGTLDTNRIQRALTYADWRTGLEVRCEAIEYRDFPAVEWVVRFKNTGAADLPLLEQVRALDIGLFGGSSGEVVIHHARGSNAEFRDFAPLADRLAPNGRLQLDSHGFPTSFAGPSGSPSVESLPFFNVECGSEGMIAAIGWTGPWIAEFTRAENGTASVTVRMDDLRAILHSGEEVRTPRMLVLFWQEDRLRAHNLWRRLLLTYYSPRPGGQPFTGLICDANWGSWMTGAKHIEEINWWGDHDLPMECYWMDAGWTDMSKGWEAHQSVQTPNPSLFPNGLQPVSDAAHARRMKFLLWMVPESVHPALGIGAEHPEWLGKPFSDPAYGTMVFHGLDHGDPKVNQFMIDHFSKLVDTHGIDIFRQDGLSLWPEDTRADRRGINQVRYTEGFYAFWDGLLKRHAGLLIDNCGCGGRKLDLETISRSLVLWRSDCQASGDFDPVSTQGFNYGLFPWVPLSGGAVPMAKLSPYSFRSAYCPAMVLCWPMSAVSDLPRQRWSGTDINLLRRLLREYLSVRPYLFGDYYPLSAYSLSPTNWMAWQFDRPDLGEGMVQAFRRPQSPSESSVCKLHGLNPNSVYALTNLDGRGGADATGRKLMEQGFSVSVPDPPGAAVITYKKIE